MFFSRKGIAIVLAVLAAVIALCAVGFWRDKAPDAHSGAARIKTELAAGKREPRHQEAEKLAVLARDLRALAQRYKANGEDKKAHRAIGAAQELDRKMRKLMEESK